MNEPASEKSRRVLIIDDNRAIHEDFRKILCPAVTGSAALDQAEAELFGEPTNASQQNLYEVDSAYQGQEGVQLVRMAREEARPYAMAFVDIRMPPGWDGVETTLQLWAIDPDVQIVLCTAYADYSWDEVFEKIGSCDGLVILKKPFDTVEALQLAQALTEKWWLHRLTRQRTVELENRVEERTRELQHSNLALQNEVVEHRRVAEELRSKTAFLEAQVNSSIDGILVVDEQGRKTLQNQKVADLFKIPKAIAEGSDDATQVQWVTDATTNPGQFAEKVAHLYSHPNETSRDEIELKDGTTLDRYSAPVLGTNGDYYGRIWTFRDVSDRKKAEETMRESEERFSGAFEQAPIGMALVSPDGRWLKVNRALCEMVGYSEAELLTRTFQEITHPEDVERGIEQVRQIIAGEIRSYQIEKRYVHRRGHLVTALLNVSLVRNAQGQPRYFVSQTQDITERKRLEGKLFESQRMETVGKLAGGVAHEFNSILTAIIGQSELMLSDLPATSPLTKNATEIREAAGRAAILTRQLLAYGRKQMLQPEILDLNAILAGMESTLCHLVGRGTEVRIVTTAGLHAVKADAGQIEQVIINIAINAAEAMPNGGRLTIETANVTLDQNYVGTFPDLKAGEYVMLAIADNGIGMSDDVRSRVFEPFFSTKGVGQGTGLGLSTCYGIVKQSGGHLSVYSEAARGAVFKVYLPQAGEQVRVPVQRPSPQDLPLGTETILLVEDDPAMREMAATLLRRLGYTVLAAADGVEALNLRQQRGSGHIDLLFTDVIMPHMSGRELADRVRALSPHTRILFTSAYTENAIIHQGVIEHGVELLQKPFTPSALAHRLREMLDVPVALPLGKL